MDNQITLEQLKQQIQEFCEARDWDQFHNPKDLAIGISTESAELLEHFRFKSDDEIKEMISNTQKRNEISEEMADILFFLLRMAQMYDFDLSTALNDKMTKNEVNYPVEKAKGSNKKYTEHNND